MVLKLGLPLEPMLDAASQTSANNGATTPSQSCTDMEFNVRPQLAPASIAPSMHDLGSDRQPSVVDIPHRSIELLNRLLEQTMALRDLYRRAKLQASGANCYDLHLLFDKHQDEQEGIASMLADRVQALGGAAFALVRDADEETSETRAPNEIETPYDKLQRLAAAHERLLVEAQPLGREAGSPDELGTHDLIRREVVRTNAQQIWFVVRLLSPPNDSDSASSLY